VVGGGGYLKGRPVLVNQTFQSFFENLEINSKHPKIGRHPNLFATHKPKKSKDFLSSSRRRSVRGGGYLEGRPILVNPTFQSFPRKLRKPEIQRKNHHGGSGRYSPERRGDRSKERNLVTACSHGKQFSQPAARFTAALRSPGLLALNQRPTADNSQAIAAGTWQHGGRIGQQLHVADAQIQQNLRPHAVVAQHVGAEIGPWLSPITL